MLRGIKAVFFDLDGVLRKGRYVIDGAPEVVRYLRNKGYQLRVITNNSGLSTPQFVSLMTELGFDFAPDELVLAGCVLARRLAELTPRGTVYLIGSEGLQWELAQQGLRVLRDPEEIDYLCDYLVAATDRDINYRKLTHALRVLLRGARLAAVNMDGVFPTEKGPMPGAGAIIGALTGMIHRGPDICVGKPAPDMLITAAASCGVSLEACVMVGDTLEADIAAAQAAGCPSVLMLTGNSSLPDVAKSPFKPTATAATLWELVKHLGA